MRLGLFGAPGLATLRLGSVGMLPYGLLVGGASAPEACGSATLLSDGSPGLSAAAAPGDSGRGAATTAAGPRAMAVKISAATGVSGGDVRDRFRDTSSADRGYSGSRPFSGRRADGGLASAPGDPAGPSRGAAAGSAVSSSGPATRELASVLMTSNIWPTPSASPWMIETDWTLSKVIRRFSRGRPSFAALSSASATHTGCRPPAPSTAPSSTWPMWIGSSAGSKL